MKLLGPAELLFVASEVSYEQLALAFTAVSDEPMDDELRILNAADLPAALDALAGAPQVLRLVLGRISV